MAEMTDRDADTWADMMRDAQQLYANGEPREALIALHHAQNLIPHHPHALDLMTDELRWWQECFIVVSQRQGLTEIMEDQGND
jgi:uncharacterized protein (DUF305 family)